MKIIIESEDLEIFIKVLQKKYIDEIELKTFKNNTFVIKCLTKESIHAMTRFITNLRGKTKPD